MARKFHMIGPARFDEQKTARAWRGLFLASAVSKKMTISAIALFRPFLSWEVRHENLGVFWEVHLKQNFPTIFYLNYWKYFSYLFTDFSNFSFIIFSVRYSCFSASVIGK